MLFDRRLHLLPQGLRISPAPENHMVVIDEEVEKLEQNERPDGELTKHSLHASAVDIQMHAQDIFQGIGLSWQHLHQIFFLTVALQLVQDVGPGHVEAVRGTTDSGAEVLFLEFFVHKVALVALDVAHHHSRPTRLHDGCLQPSDVVFEDYIRRVTPEIVVAQSHWNLAHRPTHDAVSACFAKRDTAIVADFTILHLALLAPLHILGTAEQSWRAVVFGRDPSLNPFIGIFIEQTRIAERIPAFLFVHAVPRLEAIYVEMQSEVIIVPPVETKQGMPYLVQFDHVVTLMLVTVLRPCHGLTRFVGSSHCMFPMLAGFIHVLPERYMRLNLSATKTHHGLRVTKERIESTQYLPIFGDTYRRHAFTFPYADSLHIHRYHE
jgi:hypothetical protein